MLVGNEIELGIVIPTIGSRTSKVSRDKGMGYDVYGSNDHMIFVECVGVIMGIQIPLMIIDRRGVSVMSAYSRTVG